MRTESFIAPAIFGVIAVLATTLVVSSTRDVSIRGITVVDGDTIRYNTRRVRLVGFDAPELHGRREDETLLARWARHRLEELVSSPVVRIDLVDCAAGPRDRYGRLCGRLYANRD
jgi:endonuclease YncB( thermonuclease family)